MSQREGTVHQAGDRQNQTSHTTDLAHAIHFSFEKKTLRPLAKRISRLFFAYWPKQKWVNNIPSSLCRLNQRWIFAGIACGMIEEQVDNNNPRACFFKPINQSCVHAPIPRPTAKPMLIGGKIVVINLHHIVGSRLARVW